MTAQPNVPATPAVAPSALHASASPTDTAAGTPARPTFFTLPAVTRTCSFVLPAAPDRIFPLLCPVREYDWIPTWRAEILHTVSGVAEENCVFRTTVHGGAAMTWVVNRYEPPTRIEFTCFVPDHYVFRLKIVLRPVHTGTELTWTRYWLATAPSDAAYA